MNEKTLQIHKMHFCVRLYLRKAFIFVRQTEYLSLKKKRLNSQIKIYAKLTLSRVKSCNL